MNENPTVEVHKLQPITKFIYTLGVLPTSYLMTMTYQEQVTWLCNFIQQTVIPAINDDVEAVQELQQLYIDLQDYVNNYFDNLDVTTEINNRLDAMLEDGTFQTLVDNYAQPILSDLTEDVEEAVQDVNTLVQSVETPMEEIRKEFYNDYVPFEFPVTMSSFFNKLQLYRSSDKQNYKFNLTKDDLPFVTYNLKYVDNVNGSDTNDGSSKAQAYKTLSHGIDIMNAHTTFIICNNVLYRNDLPKSNTAFNYDVNIKPENEHCIFGVYDALSWTQDGTYTNIYYATRSNISKGIDIRGNKNGVYSLLTPVVSIQECADTLNSYYTSGNTVYCNIGEAVTNEKVLFPLNIGYSPCIIKNSSKQIHVYFENIDFLCGDHSYFNIEVDSGYSPELRLYNCKLLFNSSTSDDGISLKGAKGIFMNCVADRNKKDGFNYHASSGTASYGIEINCIGSNNGFNASDNYNNGSTAHDGSQVVRINGNYFRNKGGNVTDVNNETTTININCNAFDSISSLEDGTNTDFCAQQEDTNMYLYNCYCKGSNSYYNLYATQSGAYVYYNNTEFDTSHGNGVIEIL